MSMASSHTASDVLARSDSAVRISPSPTPSGKNPSEDASGPFIDKFLLAALRNPNDRAFLLRLDTDIEAFMNDESRMSLEFPRMNSYQRLVVHRASAYWGLSHMLNQVKQCVVLHKTPDSTVPILRFTDLVTEEEDSVQLSSVNIIQGTVSESLTQEISTVVVRTPQSDIETASSSDTASLPPSEKASSTISAEDAGSTTPSQILQSPDTVRQNFKIMQRRDQKSSTERLGPTKSKTSGPKRMKTLEERQAEYEKARARIFQEMNKGKENREQRANAQSSTSHQNSQDGTSFSTVVSPGQTDVPISPAENGVDSAEIESISSRDGINGSDTLSNYSAGSRSSFRYNNQNHQNGASASPFMPPPHMSSVHEGYNSFPPNPAYYMPPYPGYDPSFGYPSPMAPPVPMNVPYSIPPSQKLTDVARPSSVQESNSSVSSGPRSPIEESSSSVASYGSPPSHLHPYDSRYGSPYPPTPSAFPRPPHPAPVPQYMYPPTPYYPHHVPNQPHYPDHIQYQQPPNYYGSRPPPRQGHDSTASSMYPMYQPYQQGDYNVPRPIRPPPLSRSSSNSSMNSLSDSFGSMNVNSSRGGYGSYQQRPRRSYGNGGQYGRMNQYSNQSNQPRGNNFYHFSYEGVKRDDISETPMPSHILQVIPKASSSPTSSENDASADIDFASSIPDATIKKISKGSTQLYLALFKNGKIAEQALTTVKNDKFELRRWEVKVLKTAGKGDK